MCQREVIGDVRACSKVLLCADFKGFGQFSFSERVIVFYSLVTYVYMFYIYMHFYIYIHRPRFSLKMDLKKPKHLAESCKFIKMFNKKLS